MRILLAHDAEYVAHALHDPMVNNKLLDKDISRHALSVRHIRRTDMGRYIRMYGILRFQKDMA